MFGNFIYFIVVLIIYLIYEPPHDIELNGYETFSLFLGLIIVFVLFTRIQFQQLSRRIADSSFKSLDNRYHAIVIRQSILAIFLFTVDVWGLNLPAYFKNLPVFSTFPTVLALLFLGLFVVYLTIVWYFAHDTYRRLYRADISKKSYVTSNIRFSLPVILPWVLLYAVHDVINILPLQAPKWFLNTTIGQVIYFLTFLIGVAIIGPSIIKHFWRCAPLVNGYARDRIEKLCETADLKYKDILQWPIFGGKMITAGVMGLVKNFRYILVTNALLHLLDPDELDMVIAHEIGHVKKKHLVFYLIFFAGFLLITLAFVEPIIYVIFSLKATSWFMIVTETSKISFYSWAEALVLITLFLLYFRFIFGYFMRNFERQADIYVYSLFDTSKPLVSTLGKIATSSGQSADRPNWHHFSIRERIEYLLKCEANPGWITRHNRKVRNSIVVFVAGIILLAATSHYLKVEVIIPWAIAQRSQIELYQEKLFLAQIDKSPENPDLYLRLGEFYYNNKDFEGARQAWEKVIELNPESASGHNSLAWLYATSEDKSVRNPVRALELAKRAAALETSPLILDTLAESYFVNGRYENAIEAEKRALSLAKNDRAFYEKQLEKYKKAAGY